MYCMGFCWKSVGIRLNGLRFPMKRHSESRGSAKWGRSGRLSLQPIPGSVVNQWATQWLQRFSPVASHKDDPFTAAFSGFAVLFPGQFSHPQGPSRSAPLGVGPSKTPAPGTMPDFMRLLWLANCFEPNFSWWEPIFGHVSHVSHFQWLLRSRNPTMGQPLSVVGWLCSFHHFCWLTFYLLQYKNAILPISFLITIIKNHVKSPFHFDQTQLLVNHGSPTPFFQ